MADKENQQAIASNLLNEFLPSAPIVNQLMEMSGQTVDFGKLIESIFTNSGLYNVKDIIKPMAQGNAPMQLGASNTGNGDTGTKPKLPNELINFKDLASVSPQSADAMLQQAGLPPMPAQAPQVPQGSVAQGTPTQTPTMNPAQGLGIPELQQTLAAINAHHSDFQNQVAQANGGNPV